MIKRATNQTQGDGHNRHLVFLSEKTLIFVSAITDTTGLTLLHSENDRV